MEEGENEGKGEAWQNMVAWGVGESTSALVHTSKALEGVQLKRGEGGVK